MKKATIKRRKRVIPASQEDGSESADSPEAMMDSTPERGTENDDGSVNLGFRRNQPSTDMDFGSRHLPNPLHDENRLPPMSSSMASVSDRQPSMSPASFLSPRRKRSFSTTETDGGSSADNADSSKRISSIKSILNHSLPNDRASSADMDDYKLPPLRSSTGPLGHGLPALEMQTGTANDISRQREGDDSEGAKAERRAALQREAERMREMLAAKERELMELGRD